MDRLAGFAGSLGAGGYPHIDDDDLHGAAEQASRHAGSSGDSDLFSSILSVVGNNKHALANEEIDEDETVKQHQRIYDGGNDHQADNSGLGSAAALQALKMMVGGQSSPGAGGSRNNFVAMAMGEASKLFDQKASQGQVSGNASKEAAIQKAAETALKLYMKSGNTGGGQGASGSVNLMSLASKFLQ